MIVKTGANYQAEGGYIEASKTGSSVNITIDGDNYNIDTAAEEVVSLYATTVSLSQEVSGAVYCQGLTKYGNVYTPAGINVTSEAPTVKYAGKTVGIYFAIGGTTGITNPVLADGSKNVVIDKYAETAARIFAIGPDAVAIIKEAA